MAFETGNHRDGARFGYLHHKTVADFAALDVGEVISISYNNNSIDTSGLGQFTLLPTISAGGAKNLDLLYEIQAEPASVIYQLQFQLSTNAEGIDPSGVVSVILSPDGDNPQDRLHMASLFSEQALSVSIPEPATLLMMLAGLVVLRPRRSI